MSGGVSYTFHIGEAAVLPGGLGRSSSFSLGNHLYEWNCEMCQARKPRVPQFVKWNVILIGWAIFFNETNTDLEVFVVLKCSRNHNRWLHHTVEKHRKKNRWTKNRFFFLHDVHWIYTFLKSNCYNIPFAITLMKSINPAWLAFFGVISEGFRCFQIQIAKRRFP